MAKTTEFDVERQTIDVTAREMGQDCRYDGSQEKLTTLVESYELHKKLQKSKTGSGLVPDE